MVLPALSYICNQLLLLKSYAEVWRIQVPESISASLSSPISGFGTSTGSHPLCVLFVSCALVQVGLYAAFTAGGLSRCGVPRAEKLASCGGSCAGVVAIDMKLSSRFPRVVC